jgi:HPt (histidine-containing phosphotransfer) domain-containing protein
MAVLPSILAGAGALQAVAKLNASMALARVGNDAVFLAELAGLFLAEYPRLLAVVRAAASRGAFGEAADSAHQLKGLLSQFAAEEARLVAAEAESAARRADKNALEVAIGKLERALAAVAPELVALTLPAPGQTPV